MKEFISAIEEVEAEDEAKAKRDARVAELVEQYRTAPLAEGETPLSEDALQHKAEQQYADETDEPHIDFVLDGRTMRAYQPTDGQLAFMLAAMGRGQSQDQRFAAIMNILISSLRPEDADYVEGRLLTRDRKQRLPIEKVEEIFEFLVEEWFQDRPTQR